MTKRFNLKTFHFIFASTLIVIATSLLSINFYGLFKDIRKENLDRVPAELLRFNNDNYIPYSESMSMLKAIEDKDPLGYTRKANKLVQQSLTHIEWDEVDPVEFRQLIPIWENYLLYFVGVFSNQPQLKRYHFTNYKRSLERGIGICGDASMVLSQILDIKGIENQIVSYRGHVITEVTLRNNKKRLFDPDFGVELNMSLDELSANPSSAYPYYLAAGYNERDARVMVKVYSRKHTLFDDVYAFMPKRYVFEYLSYILIWLIPAVMMFASLIILKRIKKSKPPSN